MPAATTIFSVLVICRHPFRVHEHMKPIGHPWGCSRREFGRLAGKLGKAIKGYASGKFLPLGLGSALASGSRNGRLALDPHLYEVAYANRGFKETD